MASNIICTLKNTVCLEHIESLSATYGCLYHETQVEVPLNICAVHPLMFFSVNFLHFHLLSQSVKRMVQI